jgi:hydroxymethylglutaryl-CoA synthase
MANTYDFYKPNLESEYPEVDGALSVKTYIGALDAAYKAYQTKFAQAHKRAHAANGHANSNGHANGTASAGFTLDSVDYHVFHSPYGKQAQKAYARLLYDDFVKNPSHANYASLTPEQASAFSALSYDESLTHKDLEKAFMALSKKSYAAKVTPSMACSKRCGNMYTGSLYSCLASLLDTVEPQNLQGKRASMFGFGSGCAASFWTVHFKGDTSEIRNKMRLNERLAAMKVVPPQQFIEALAVSSILSRVLVRLFYLSNFFFPQ